MHPIIITPPAAQPVSLVDSKMHLRIDHDEEDILINSLIDAATNHVEDHTGLMLIERTVRQFEDGNSPSVKLKGWPFIEIVEVTHYDKQGNSQVLTASDYLLHRGDPPILEFSSGLIHECNGIEIDYKVGFGETGVDVPSNIIRAILLLIGHWYEFRGSITDDTRGGFIPDGWSTLLQPARRVKL